MRHLVEEEGSPTDFEIDSAGTGSWHIGDPPDPRSVAAAAARGITIGGHARQVTGADFDHYDLILAADAYNLRDLQAIAPTDEDEAKVQHAARVRSDVDAGRPRRARPVLRRTERLRRRDRPRRGGLSRAARRSPAAARRPDAWSAEAIARGAGVERSGSTSIDRRADSLAATSTTPTAPRPRAVRSS